MMTALYIPQAQLAALNNAVTPGKVVLVYGARRVGKTTLLSHFLREAPGRVLSVSGEDIVVRDALESQSVEKLRTFVGNHDLLAIDEAQYIKKVGLNLKLLIDHIDGLAIVATGSSSFDLAADTGAPLTGRKWTLRLYPLAQMELSSRENNHETRAHLETRLIYGSYPEVVINQDASFKQRYLRELISSYLFQDILRLENIRNADKLTKILQLLAFQIGSEVSLTELGTQVGMSKNTVERYLDLLEKVFVIYKRSGFSRNLRKEISKSKRYYFYDNGIRNALINNFNPLSIRDDTGMLWENYMAVERLKFNAYTGRSVDSYFWRTYDQKEIDLIEEADGKLSAFEFKWQPRNSKAPSDWTRTYGDAGFHTVHADNYLSFISH